MKNTSLSRMRCRVERAVYVAAAFDCIDAARTARKAGRADIADFYAWGAAVNRCHAAAAIAKAKAVHP